MRRIDCKMTQLMGMSCVFVALLCAPLMDVPGIVVAEPTHLMDQEVEKAILAEEWSKVADLLDSDDSLTSASVARLIKGHACLALNRNNESLELFLNASSAEDLERWEEWTLGFAKQNPHNAAVHYLKGDAFARMEQWDSAILAFDKALQIKPDYPLALNARGVALCACGRWDDAEADFERICQVAPSFADGQASLGTYLLSRHQTTAASEAYNRALEFSPEFVLAMNGRGCTRFKQGPKEWEQANEEFANAGKHLNLSVVCFNADILNQAATESASKANLYFQPKDFVDWVSLRHDIGDKSSVLHAYFQDIPIPKKVDRNIIDNFNEILEDDTFYDKNKAKIDHCIGPEIANPDSTDLRKLVMETSTVRKKDKKELDAREKSAIRGLNRGILEQLYPSMIAQADTTEAGMSLTRTGGIAYGGLAYKQSLPTKQLQAGLHHMRYTYGPMATFLKSLPPTRFIGSLWQQHLHSSIAQTKTVLQQRGVTASLGGVSTIEMMSSFFRSDNWPAATWFGLGYNVPAEEN